MTLNRTIPENEMIGRDFRFGKNLIDPNQTISWNPDDPQSLNPHLMIFGQSGSGKTRLLKKIIEYLQDKRKNIFVVDFHGDMGIDGENHIEFTGRNSRYGINPFEFDVDEKNGGPKVNANIIVTLFKKSFMPNMGAVMRSILKQLIIDTYEYVGINDENPDTWHKELPGVKDLKAVYDMVRNGQKARSANGALPIFENIEKHRESLWEAMDDEDQKALGKRSQKVSKLFEELSDHISRYKEFVYERRHAEEFDLQSDGIDLDPYLSKSAQSALDNLEPYINELAGTNVFSESRPPLQGREVNRFDISGFTSANKPDEALFFADVLIQRVFRKCKMRGEYRLMPQEKKNGAKVDTFIVLDESKLILPKGKEKDNPYNVLNRIVTESRKYGLGIIIVSQRPDHFTQEILGSVFAKISLKLAGEEDIKSAAKALGIKDRRLFEQAENFGVAICGVSGRKYKSVALPWVQLDKTG